MADQPGMAWVEIAKSAYLAYGYFVGNKNAFGGDMPKWEDLPEKIRHAWQAAARQVGHCFDFRADLKAGECYEERYKAWIPPAA